MFRRGGEYLGAAGLRLAAHAPARAGTPPHAHRRWRLGRHAVCLMYRPEGLVSWPDDKFPVHEFKASLRHPDGPLFQKNSSYGLIHSVFSTRNYVVIVFLAPKQEESADGERRIQFHNLARSESRMIVVSKSPVTTRGLPEVWTSEARRAFLTAGVACPPRERVQSNQTS